MMLRLLASSLLASACMVCAAGEQTGLVSSLRVTSKTISSNPSHVAITGTRSGQPACATLVYWAFDTDTAAGKSFLATLLASQAANKPVRIYGTNECSLRPGMEGVQEINLDQ